MILSDEDKTDIKAIKKLLRLDHLDHLDHIIKETMIRNKKIIGGIITLTGNDSINNSQFSSKLINSLKKHCNNSVYFQTNIYNTVELKESIKTIQASDIESTFKQIFNLIKFKKHFVVVDTLSELHVIPSSNLIGEKASYLARVIPMLNNLARANGSLVIILNTSKLAHVSSIPNVCSFSSSMIWEVLPDPVKSSKIVAKLIKSRISPPGKCFNIP
jgi:hypothetical protein